MSNLKNDFLSGCISGFNDSKIEDPEWLNMTKTEKKKMAEQALKDFDRIFYGFECVITAGNYQRNCENKNN